MRRLSIALVNVALAWVALAACSTDSAHPPLLGPCEFDGASCSVGAVGGGVGGAADSGATPSACQVNAGDSQCTQCAEASCCGAFAACTASADCENLLNCEPSCATAACVSSCETQSPNGVALLDTLQACLQTRCPVCSELGVGDPCTPDGTACNAGLLCSGLWCTKGCLRSTDCAGLGPAGGNALGFQNACIVTATAGDQCLPGCAADSDCSSFPGAFCFATTSSEGLSVRVCAATPDAGTD